MSMSWLARNTPLRNSFGKKRNGAATDPDACLETFSEHWFRIKNIIHSTSADGVVPTSDEVWTVLTQLDQMTSLLLTDVRMHTGIGPVTSYLLTERVLEILFPWSLKVRQTGDGLKLQQLKVYELLISNSQGCLLAQEGVMRPLLLLLESCEECLPSEMEKRLLILLNQICVSICQSNELLPLFFNQTPPRFLLFSLLISYVHRDGAIGQLARDAMLLCMSLSRENDALGRFIAESSNFCPVVATGLSGLYSRLPRKIALREGECWRRLSSDDVTVDPALNVFMRALEFCNAVMEVAHPLVQEQLLEYIHQGFLLPVVAPALHQNTVEDVAGATAYLDLFLRSITERQFLHAFLRFILTECYEGESIMLTLISRIKCTSKLCLVTLSLFYTLLDLNCEDIMLELIFKYLVPCNHVMLSQRSHVGACDLLSDAAERFLSLIPSCCGGQRQPEYLVYLSEARRQVKDCSMACRHWTYQYDGEDPSPAQIRQLLYQDNEAQVNEEVTSDSGRASRAQKLKTPYLSVAKLPEEGALDSIGESSGYESFSFVKMSRESSPDKGSKDVDEPFWQMIKDTKTPPECGSIEDSINEMEALLKNLEYLDDVNKHSANDSDGTLVVETHSDLDMDDYGTPRSPVSSLSPVDSSLFNPYLGPFLDTVLQKVECLDENDIVQNLLLTQLVSRLAAYPQPLLRSLLLNHVLTFQPAIRPLSAVLSSLKHKIDSEVSSIDNYSSVIMDARKYLMRRTRTKSTDGPSSNPDVYKGERKRRSFSDIFRRAPISNRPPTNNRENSLQNLGDGSGYRYVHRTPVEAEPEVNRSVVAAVLLEEWMHELAAISQEHQVIQEELQFMLPSQR